MIEYCKGTPVSILLDLPDFHINWQKVKAAVTPKTKAIVINSPHNPAGSVLKKTDITHLIEIVRNTEIIIIADEVYEHIIFDGQKHLSISAYPELAERAFVISSMGKTFHATGWKVGYCLAPEEMMKEFRKIHQFVTFSVNTPAQYAYADFLQDKNNYLELAGFYQEKRNLFRQLMDGSRFDLLPCAGTYFQLAGYKNISDEPDTKFVEWLTHEHKIAAIPTSVFYTHNDDNKIIRFCFAKKEKTLTKAAEVLCRI
jgi:methionine aminotransferase